MLRVALFYDWLNQWGGAEKVLLNLLKLYPQATLFTLVHNPKKTPWLPPKTKIVTSFIQQLPRSSANPIFYTPLYDLALEQFDFSQYDVIISTTSVLGHCFLTHPQTLYITYFHNINRHLYSRPYLKFYQNIDRIYSHRPDYIFCNSHTVANRISATYNRTPTIIYPGIDTDKYVLGNQLRQNYFLTVSRLVAHKKIDIAIEACGELGLNLKVVGTGRDEKYLKLVAKRFSTIQFLGNVSETRLISLYQQSQGLICPQIEDFGLTAIEAQACGCPVIALRQGGLTETVLENKTGLFFDQQTPSSLKKIIIKFLNCKFSAVNCRKQSLNFSDKNFMLNFDKSIQNLWKLHLTTT